MLVVKPITPVRLARPPGLPFPRFGKGQEIGSVQLAHRGKFAFGLEMLPPVLADRLEHRKACLGACTLDPLDEAVVGQLGQAVEHGRCGH